MHEWNIDLPSAADVYVYEEPPPYPGIGGAAQQFPAGELRRRNVGVSFIISIYGDFVHLVKNCHRNVRFCPLRLSVISVSIDFILVGRIAIPIAFDQEY